VTSLRTGHPTILSSSASDCRVVQDPLRGRGSGTQKMRTVRAAPWPGGGVIEAIFGVGCSPGWQRCAAECLRVHGRGRRRDASRPDAQRLVATRTGRARDLDSRVRRRPARFPLGGGAPWLGTRRWRVGPPIDGNRPHRGRMTAAPICRSVLLTPTADRTGCAGDGSSADPSRSGPEGWRMAWRRNDPSPGRAAVRATVEKHARDGRPSRAAGAAAQIAVVAAPS